MHRYFSVQTFKYLLIYCYTTKSLCISYVSFFQIFWLKDRFPGPVYVLYPKDFSPGQSYSNIRRLRSGIDGSEKNRIGLLGDMRDRKRAVSGTIAA